MTLEAKDALRVELERHGYEVTGDTVGLRGELYVRGDGDDAAALFEFKSTCEEAFATMYQGSWSPALPPRFAVLPESQRDHPELELLVQAGLSVLLYRFEDSGERRVVFADLDAALDKIDRCESG